VRPAAKFAPSVC